MASDFKFLMKSPCFSLNLQVFEEVDRIFSLYLFFEVDSSAIDENIFYVMPFACALQNLLQENYDSILATIECNTVSADLMRNDSLKIFDSHARDSLGIAQPHWTCVW